jgi:sugar lactone lactonase YvrE
MRTDRFIWLRRKSIAVAAVVSMFVMAGAALAWDLSTASYDNVKFKVGLEPTSTDVAFSSDGTKMYVIGSLLDSVDQYTLTSGWDVSTAVYHGISFSVNGQDAVPNGLTFKSDGTKMYVVGSNSDAVYQYSLSSAWDLSTASYDSVSFSVAGQETTAQALAFKSDGTKMYVVGWINNTVYQYSLSSAWDLSTASYDSVSFSVVGQESGSNGLTFKSDGTKMYMAGGTNDTVYQYSLSSAWNLSTASYDSVSFSVTGHETAPQGVAFKSDGTKMYIVGSTGDRVYQYSLTAWDLSTASYDSVSANIAGQEATSTGVAFKSDGTKMYVVGLTNDTVYQYSLSSAWNVSTASYDSVSFSVSVQDINPHGLTFKSDGTKMYVAGTSGDRVYQYSLSSAWDLSTASYDSVSFAVNTQDTNPQGLTFKSDGTKMYIAGPTADKIFQYSLSSAWDISTASYDSVSFSIITQENASHDLTFKSDGTKMYVVGITNDTVYQYSLSSAWDISTASYDSVLLSVSAQENNPSGIFFKSDGSKMYLIGATNDAVHQYSLSVGDSTAPSISTLSPTDNATGVSATVNLVITFDEATRAGTGTLAIKKTSDNSTLETITVSGALLSGNGTTSLTLNPSTTLAESTSYYVTWTANAFKDASSNHVAVQTSMTYWNFTTGDFTAPSISTLSPTDGAVDSATTANLVLTFDEATRAGTGTLAIKKTSDNSTVETITVSGALLSGNGTTSLTLNPSTTLAESTSYYITWTANAFKDTSGNHVAVQTSTTYWNFTTVAAAASSSSSSTSTQATTTSTGGRRGSTLTMTQRIQMARSALLARITRRKTLQKPLSPRCTSMFGKVLHTQRCAKRSS